jgi:hypothetical protein
MFRETRSATKGKQVDDVIRKGEAVHDGRVATHAIEIAQRKVVFVPHRLEHDLFVDGQCDVGVGNPHVAPVAIANDPVLVADFSMIILVIGMMMSRWTAHVKLVEYIARGL